jgi:K+-sensing histidine kinase KdpD
MDITDQMEILEDLHEEQALRDKLIHSLSHDLRTPLTAAKMAAQLMKRNATNHEATLKQSERIIVNIDRADKMIQDLLDASRIKAGQLMKPTIEKIIPEEVILRSLENLKTIHGERFHFSCQKGIEVFSWEQGLMRILDNLCSNAIKYGDPQANIDIDLKTEKDYFVLAVHNFGIPIEHNINFFDEFQRATSAEESGKKGWGIGLPIVKGISESIGGEVQIKRHEDGTTFEVFLPIDSRDKIPTNILSSGQQ